MLKIIENNITNISYTIQSIVNDKCLNEYIVKCKSCNICINGKNYLVIFNTNSEVIDDAFKYLNIFLEDKTIQTREMSMIALKYLYSFCEIFSVDPKKMDYADCSKFLNFLYGRSCYGNDFTLEFNTVRSSNSVNSYFSAIRSYLMFLGCESHPLLLQKTKTKSFYDQSYIQPAYKIKPKTFNRKKVPLYIKIDEFKSMLANCRKKNDLQLECIIRLMFQSGLRIGEVLGLTMEDIIEENGNCKVILRNRITDRKYQKAKFLMTITDKNQYSSKDYNIEWYGWNEMAISPDLYNQLMEYIENAHSDLIDNNYKKWAKSIKTDAVTEEYAGDNFYIFINKHHTPMSNKTLEQKIKELFIACDIPLNKDGGKFDGLAHRFRHGFAMYQITVNNLDNLLLSKIMRHRSLESVEAYFTPELSDIVRIKNDLSESIYDLLPRFELDEESKA